jgi:hypothetical protein
VAVHNPDQAGMLVDVKVVFWLQSVWHNSWTLAINFADEVKSSQSKVFWSVRIVYPNTVRDVIRPGLKAFVATCFWVRGS